MNSRRRTLPGPREGPSPPPCVASLLSFQPELRAPGDDRRCSWRNCQFVRTLPSFGDRRRNFAGPAVAGDRECVRRLQTVSARTSLAAAQLAVVREHGFDSWPSLRVAVNEARTAAAGPLMANKHEKAAVYAVAHLLAGVRDQGWSAGTIPAGVVFTAQTFITAHLADTPDRYTSSETLTPTNGRVFVTATDPLIAIACLGVGAPALVTVLEAYRKEGVLVTEMVTAALFAVAAALHVRAASAVMATRTLGVAAPALPPERHGGQVLTLIDAAVSVLQRLEATA